MARPITAIGATEELYRTLREGDADGDHVFPEALEMPRCSVKRGAYIAAKDALETAPQDHAKIAVTTRDRLPPPLYWPNSQAWFAFEVDDDPETEEPNDPHAEVRLKKQGVPYNIKSKPNSKLLVEACIALTHAFRVLPITRS